MSIGKLKGISAGDWERSGKNIQTRGGTFLGYATTVADAELMSKAVVLLEIVVKHSEGNAELAKELNELLKRD